MEGIVYREMQPEDVFSTITLRNEVFADAPVTQEDWERDNMLASIAVLEEEVVGAIPLILRETVIAPGVTITAHSRTQWAHEKSSAVKALAGA